MNKIVETFKWWWKLPDNDWRVWVPLLIILAIIIGLWRVLCVLP